MTALQFANKIRTYTKQNSSSLADADILSLANPLKDQLAELIATRDIKGNYFILPSLVDFVAGQREYPLPDDVLDHIFSVEIAFTSTTDSFGEIQYVMATKDDFRKTGLARREMYITSRYTNNRPSYEVQRRAIYLLSGKIDATTLGSSTITSGIRIRYRVYPADLVALSDNMTDLSVDPTTTTFGFPRQFHELWARACAIEWKAAHPGAVPPTQLDGAYPTDLEAKLKGIEENDFSEEVISSLPYQDGADD